jgi:restriction system protein
VRELFGVMAAEGAVGGFVVASGAFTEEAKRFVEGRAIELVGTDTLLTLIQSGAAQPVVQPAVTEIACPQCRAPMVQRTAKQGATAGERFWGCTRYPACRGTRPA